MESHLGRFVIFYPTSLGMKTYAGESSSIASDLLIQHLTKLPAGDIDLYEHIKSMTLMGGQILMSATPPVRVLTKITDDN